MRLKPAATSVAVSDATGSHAGDVRITSVAALAGSCTDRTGRPVAANSKTFPLVTPGPLASASRRRVESVVDVGERCLGDGSLVADTVGFGLFEQTAQFGARDAGPAEMPPEHEPRTGDDLILAPGLRPAL